ncbi:hypothetical protein FRC00_005594, partial [Tulasnella sp. 408]
MVMNAIGATVDSAPRVNLSDIAPQQEGGSIVMFCESEPQVSGVRWFEKHKMLTFCGSDGPSFVISVPIDGVADNRQHRVPEIPSPTN